MFTKAKDGNDFGHFQF